MWIHKDDDLGPEICRIVRLKLRIEHRWGFLREAYCGEAEIARRDAFACMCACCKLCETELCEMNLQSAENGQQMSGSSQQESGGSEGTVSLAAPGDELIQLQVASSAICHCTQLYQQSCNLCSTDSFNQIYRFRSI